MPPTTKSINNRPICKVCPKPKPKPKPSQVSQPEIAPEYEEAEDEEEEAEVVEDPCLNVGDYGDFDLTTTEYVLEEILPARRRKKPTFFSSCADKTRYDNLVPSDVTNDHQYRASQQKGVLHHRSLLQVTSNPRWKRVPAIVATIGPSCILQEEIASLMYSGMNIARVNLAYGDRCSHLSMIQSIRAAEKTFIAKIGFRTPIAIMLDLKGTRVLTGRICTYYVKDCRNPELLLAKDTFVTLTIDKYAADKCTPKLVYINNKNLLIFARPGMRVFLDDGAVKLLVQRVLEREIICTVEEEGSIRNYSSVHLPMVPTTQPPYTPDDVEDILMAIDEDVDAVTLPSARHPASIQDIRERLMEKLLIGKKIRERPLLLFAKISSYEGLKNIDGIIDTADGIVIQRGNLALDIPPEKVTIAQKEIIAKCNLKGKPVICSTQMMQSMLLKLRPTGSDMADVAGCMYDGADCISLTHETAIGKYPNDVIELANHIIREADAATYQRTYQNGVIGSLVKAIDPKLAIASAACTIAEKIRTSAIIVLTTSGKSAKYISMLRPRVPVIAITPYERTARQLNFWRCILPLHYVNRCIHDWFMDMERRFQHGIAYGKTFGFIRCGDPIVLVSGYGKDIGYTNCVRIVYASTEPDIYLQHSRNFYGNLYSKKYLAPKEEKPPDNPCK